MPSEAMNMWFKSRKPAQIEDIHLTLRPHTLIRNAPLSSMQGQAEAFFTTAADGSLYILKHFYDSKRPRTDYLNAVHALLPKHPAFRCGTERKVLTKKSLIKAPGLYATQKLAAYLEDTVLMPQIEGLDWAGFSSQIRNGRLFITPDQRMKLCSNLAQVVKFMEDNRISHRDLSSGNVFINPKTLDVALIDFDSVYHPSLKMPARTTVGSEGYTAPFVSADKPEETFGPLADRFALAILCAEFLVMDSNSPFCHEGGIFEQDEINKRRGKTLDFVGSRLKSLNPHYFARFHAALNSRNYADCPSPQDWMIKKPVVVKAPSLNSLPQVKFVSYRPKRVHVVKLPENPWTNLKGVNRNGTAPPCMAQRHSPVLKPVRPLDPNSTANVYLQSVATPVARPMGKGLRSLFKKGFALLGLCVGFICKKFI